MAINVTDDMRVIWSILMENLKNADGVSGLMGNLYAESGCRANNLQNSYERKMNMTDRQYTDAVDNGTYKDFASDKAGYGLVQWTSRPRKQNLYGFAKAFGQGIGSVHMQTLFMLLELQNYSIVMDVLKHTDNIYEAAAAVLKKYEKPRNTSDSNARKRADIGREIYYALYGTGKEAGPEWLVRDYRVLKRGSSGEDVRKLQNDLMALGYRLPRYGADGKYGKETADAIRRFQETMKLYADGKAGAVTQACVTMALTV